MREPEGAFQQRERHKAAELKLALLCEQGPNDQKVGSANQWERCHFSVPRVRAHLHCQQRNQRSIKTDDIIVSHKNGTVSFFSRSLQLIHSVQIHEEEIRSIEALKNDNMLLTASFDGHVAFFNEHNSHEPSYFQHNDSGDDKVVFATFLHSADYRGFSSTSAQGLCHIYSY